MSVAEKLTIGVQTTVLGLVVVFIALAMIILIIVVMGRLMHRKKKEKSATQEAPQQPVVQAMAPAIPSMGAQDAELVAVLSAAAAAYMGSGGSSNNLVVRSYRRISVDSPWAKAGRNAQIYNKF